MSQVFAKHFSLSRDLRLNRTLASAVLHKITYMKKDKQVKYFFTSALITRFCNLQTVSQLDPNNFCVGIILGFQKRSIEIAMDLVTMDRHGKP